jgi:hypothetical protein
MLSSRDPTHALLKVLDVCPERRKDKDASHVNAPDNPVKPEEAPSESVGKLHRAQQGRAAAGQRVWQQPPFE